MLLCICRGPRKGANYCTEETMCSLQLHLQPEKQTKIPTTCTLCWYLGMFSWLYTFLVSWYVFLAVHFVDILVCFPGCTLCWYRGMFSWLYTLLVSWYVFLAVHFVGILVRFPGCTLCWYLGTYLVYFVGILVCFPGCIVSLCWYFGILVTFPGCTLCRYLGTLFWL